MFSVFPVHLTRAPNWCPLRAHQCVHDATPRLLVLSGGRIVPCVQSFESPCAAILAVRPTIHVIVSLYVCVNYVWYIKTKRVFDGRNK